MKNISKFYPNISSNSDSQILWLKKKKPAQVSAAKIQQLGKKQQGFFPR